MCYKSVNWYVITLKLASKSIILHFTNISMTNEIISNPLIDRLPPHLKQFIKPQDYEDYSAINQAVWRFVMRKNVSYLSKVAHESYTRGLDMTGISIDDIPGIDKI